MDDLVSVTVFHRADYLLKELPGTAFTQTAVPYNIVKQLHGRIFQDHDDVEFGGYDSVPIIKFVLAADSHGASLADVQFDDVWMTQQL